MIDPPHEPANNTDMQAPPENSVKSALHAIADQLPKTATFDDAMNELLLRMQLAAAREDVRQGRLVSQDDIDREFE